MTTTVARSARLVSDRKAAFAPYGPAVCIVAIQLLLYPVPKGVWLLGVVLGLLGSLVALGLALIQRANRILNFAQADLGTVPTAFAYGCITSSWSLPYLLSFSIGLVGAAVLGALVELLIIRRFFTASRMVLTVATIGVSQLFLVAALLMPRIWGNAPLGDTTIRFPWHLEFAVGTQLFHSDDVFAVVLVVIVLSTLGLFLGRSGIGIAVRASAERSDRAGMLGIPVKRINTLVWSAAAVISFLGVFARASILGLPLNATIGLSSMVAAFTALVLAGAACLPAVVVTAVALGILEQGVGWHAGNKPALIYVAYALVILVALLLRRTGTKRADIDDTASWQTADDVRPLPLQLRRLPEVRALRWSVLVAAGTTVVLLGFWLGPANQQRAATVACFCLITLSIVVLTGWAGQVSLGQMSFVAFGAVAGAVAVATWHWDLSLAVMFAGVVGAIAAMCVGLPALRLRGPYLAVATLAFALATTGYLANRATFAWIPNGRIDRPVLFATIDLTSEGRMYAVCVATTLIALAAMHGLRESRVGRTLRAVRSNDRAAQAYGVHPAIAKLTAFAISGFLAGIAGCLLTMISRQYSETPFAADQSIAVFTASVVGGIGSLWGAVIGAVFAKGGTWFLPSSWQLLPSALGVLGVLMLLPSGLVDGGIRIRDIVASRAAARRHIPDPNGPADHHLGSNRDVTIDAVQLTDEADDIDTSMSSHNRGDR